MGTWGVDLGRVLIVVGLLIAAVGVVVTIVGALGLGRLPGDFAFKGRNVRVYVPLASSILVSIVLTILLNVLARR
jgi:hypothetical protein